MAPGFTLGDLLASAAERSPDAPAIVDGGRTLTYGELALQADAVAGSLHDLVAKGDRVAIWMEKSVESIVAMLGVTQAGGAFVNVNPALKHAQVEHIVRDAGARVLFAEGERIDGWELPPVEAVFHHGPAPAGAWSTHDLGVAMAADSPPPRRRSIETDLATILYTSGSTGMPKGVAFSQHNLVVGARIVASYLRNTSEDRILSMLPFSFDYGLNQLTTSILVGATLIVQHSRLPGDLIHGLRRSRATGLAGVPPVWSLLLRSASSLEAEPPADLRYITNSGGRIPQANLDALRRLLPRTSIFLMYGLTEAFRSTYLPPDELDRGSDCIGIPIPDTDIMVIKDGRECEPDEVGELVHRGPTVALGYWGQEEATRRAYRPNPLAPPELLGVERVVHSGDLVRRDGEGYLFFVGRDDAMIKSQGYRMSPEEVEGVLVSSGLVREACAFGMPDEDLGHRVVAVVTLVDEAPPDALDRIRRHAIDEAPTYMVPSRIIAIEELPRTASGKIDRPAVRDTYGTDVHAG